MVDNRNNEESKPLRLFLKSRPALSNRLSTKRLHGHLAVLFFRASLPAIYDRAMSGKSLRAAINAKCNDCSGGYSFRRVNLSGG